MTPGGWRSPPREEGGLCREHLREARGLGELRWGWGWGSGANRLGLLSVVGDVISSVPWACEAQGN